MLQNIPGPGHYDFQSQFSTQSEPNDFAPFGSTTIVSSQPHTVTSYYYCMCIQRFYDSDTSIPPPGAYDDPRTALEATKRCAHMLPDL